MADFVITPEHMRVMAQRRPETLGSMILCLAVPLEDDIGFDFEPQNGWTRTSPGKAAAARHPGKPMRGYTDPHGEVVLTSIQGETVALFAEGDGWEIECEEMYGGWMEGGFFAGRQPANTLLDESKAQTPAATIDLKTAGYRNPPTYLHEDFDWIAQTAFHPTSSLTRLHALAMKAGLAWTDVQNGRRPLGDMMRLIEERRDLPTVTGDEVHPLTLTERIRIAETNLGLRAGDEANDQMVRLLLDQLGFAYEEGINSDDESWMLELCEPEFHLLASKDGCGWRISRGPLPGEPQGEWINHATGLSPEKALIRIHAISNQPAQPLSFEGPIPDETFIRLARDVGSHLVMKGPGVDALTSLDNIEKRLGLAYQDSYTVQYRTQMALLTAYGRQE